MNQVSEVFQGSVGHWSGDPSRNPANQSKDDRLAELERENSKLRARLAFTEKLYAEIVPEKPFAWIEQENVVTDPDVFHIAVVRFLELNVDAFDELLATMHKAYVESENTEAQITAKGEF